MRASSSSVESAARSGMAHVPGGTFAMGCERFYPEEAPVRRVTVDGFWIDRHPVTVREFRRFVAETGYVTLAERPVEAAAYPDPHPLPVVPAAPCLHLAAAPAVP